MFEVSPDAYGRFMGRYSWPLAPLFLDAVGVPPRGRALDVGCGSGALTGVLVDRFGVDAVSAADPSEPLVSGLRERFPGLDVRIAPAEDLPFPDDDYDAVLAQLVVHFMADPVRGIAEMARTARPGGIVATCVWDGATGPLADFWAAVRTVDPSAVDESRLNGAREGHLGELSEQAGLRDVETGVVTVTIEHPDFDDWWEPYTFGVGPAGAYVRSLDEQHRAEVREACRAGRPDGPFTTSATAWTAVGRA
jgi:SAM-dependent methyltransferase